MFKGAIFDLDDLLVDSTACHVAAWELPLSRFGVKYSDLPEALKSANIGRTVYEITGVVVGYFNLPISQDELYKERLEIFLAKIRDSVKLMPGAGSLLESLKENGIPTALATSGSPEYVSIILEKFTFRKYFKAVVTAGDVSKGKPSPEIYLKACEKLGFSPNECVVFEDATNGIIAAKKAGCFCVAIPSPNPPKQDQSLADMILPSLEAVDTSSLF